MVTSAAEKGFRGLVNLWQDGRLHGFELSQAVWVVAVEPSREQAMKAARALIQSHGGSTSDEEKQYETAVGWFAKSLRSEDFDDFRFAVITSHKTAGVAVPSEINAVLEAFQLVDMVRKNTLQLADVERAVGAARAETVEQFAVALAGALNRAAAPSRQAYVLGSMGLRLVWCKKGPEIFDRLTQHLLVLAGAPSTQKLLLDLCELLRDPLAQANVSIIVQDDSEPTLIIGTPGVTFQIVVARALRVR